MIILYNSDNGYDYKYFNSSEDYWNESIEYADMFLKDCNKYYYVLDSYDDVKNIDIFKLKNEPIKELEKYLVLSA